MESWISKRKPLGGPQGGTTGSVGKQRSIFFFFYSWRGFILTQKKKKVGGWGGLFRSRTQQVSDNNLGELKWKFHAGTLGLYYYFSPFYIERKNLQLLQEVVAGWYVANVTLCADKEALKGEISDFCSLQLVNYDIKKKHVNSFVSFELTLDDQKNPKRTLHGSRVLCRMQEHH